LYPQIRMTRYTKFIFKMGSVENQLESGIFKTFVLIQNRAQIKFLKMAKGYLALEDREPERVLIEPSSIRRCKEWR